MLGLAPSLFIISTLNLTESEGHKGSPPTMEIVPIEMSCCENKIPIDKNDRIKNDIFLNKTAVNYI